MKVKMEQTRKKALATLLKNIATRINKKKEA